jgi:hypothetical protein
VAWSVLSRHGESTGEKQKKIFTVFSGRRWDHLVIIQERNRIVAFEVNVRSKEIKNEFSNIADRHQKLKTEMDGLIPSIQNELAQLSERWIQREVQSQVSERPQRINDLGLEKIRLFKAKVANLIASLPELTKQEISDSAKWPQNDTGQNDGYFNDIHRNVASNLGLILNEFGFLDTSSKAIGVYPNWRRTASGKFTYTISMVSDRDRTPTPAMAQFQRALEEYRRLTAELERKGRELEAAKAQELWDSA